MDEPPSAQPPPLPPAPGKTAPAPVDFGPALRRPPPAPLPWRTLAYLVDWSIALVAVILILQWLVPARHPEGLADLRVWSENASAAINGYLANPPPPAQIVEKYGALVKNLSDVPESVAALVAFIAMVQTVFFWAFFTITEYFTNGASLGKKMFNLRVASINDLAPPAFFDTFFRSGWKAVFFCSSSIPLLLIGVIDAHVPLFNARRRSWHDMLSRTEVVDARGDVRELDNAPGEENA